MPEGIAITILGRHRDHTLYDIPKWEKGATPARLGPTDPLHTDPGPTRILTRLTQGSAHTSHYWPLSPGRPQRGVRRGQGEGGLQPAAGATLTIPVGWQRPGECWAPVGWRWDPSAIPGPGGVTCQTGPGLGAAGRGRPAGVSRRRGRLLLKGVKSF